MGSSGGFRSWVPLFNSRGREISIVSGPGNGLEAVRRTASRRAAESINPCTSSMVRYCKDMKFFTEAGIRTVKDACYSNQASLAVEFRYVKGTTRLERAAVPSAAATRHQPKARASSGAPIGGTPSNKSVLHRVTRLGCEQAHPNRSVIACVNDVKSFCNRGRMCRGEGKCSSKGLPLFSRSFLLLHGRSKSCEIPTVRQIRESSGTLAEQLQHGDRQFSRSDGAGQEIARSGSRY